ncbi:hypothetical protein BH23ACT10_BH23ACT10_02430 [soil metagenome]
MLTPGEDGDWDARRVAEPSVIVTDDGWQMYYVGFDQERTARIGLATSADGISWDRHDGPVLEGGAEWDGGAIGSPNVLAMDDALLLVYDNAVRGQYGLGFARSSDGVTWSPDADNPQLTADDAPGPQFFQYELVRGPDGLLFLLEAGSGSTRTDIYAYRLDG